MAIKNQLMLYVRNNNNVNLLRIQTLLDRGSDVNAENSREGKCTALIYATRHSIINFQLIELLLKSGSNVEAINRSEGHCTALLYAIRKTDINYEVIDLLLQNRANVNATDISNGLSVLMYAIKNPNVKYEIVELLLRYEANISATNPKDGDCTTLHYAVINTNLRYDIIELLLQKGVNVNAENRIDGNTALLYAVRKPNVDCDVIELLLKYGAEVNGESFKDYLGPPLPYLLKKSNFNLNLIELLLRFGANINIRNGMDALKTPLLYAVQNPNCPYELIELLVENGADVNSINYVNKDSPLIYAAKHSNLKLVELFLQNRAKVHHLNRDDYCAVVYAVKRPKTNRIVDEANRFKIVELLLKYANRRHPNIPSGNDCRSCIKVMKFFILEQVKKNPCCISDFYDCKSVLGEPYHTLFSMHFSNKNFSTYVERCVCEILQMKKDGIYSLLLPSPVIDIPPIGPRAIVDLLISLWSTNIYPRYSEVFKSSINCKDLYELLGKFRIHARSFKRAERIEYLDWATLMIILEYISLEDMLHLAAAYFGSFKIARDTESRSFIPKRQRLR